MESSLGSILCMNIQENREKECAGEVKAENLVDFSKTPCNEHKLNH
jgi:hypothetical protein